MTLLSFYCDENGRTLLNTVAQILKVTFFTACVLISVTKPSGAETHGA